MTLDVKAAFRAVWRVHPTIARLAGIFVGIYLMGAHDFLVFYLVHMLLKSLTALFFVDSHVLVFWRVRRISAIDLAHFPFLVAMSIASSLFIAIFYLIFIWLFDKFVAPNMIDIEFFKLYALTIFSNILMPFVGLIKARGSLLVKGLALRSQHLMTLIFIAAFVIMGFDGALLPYVWLLTSILVSLMVLLLGMYYFYKTEKTGHVIPVDWQRGKVIAQRIIGHSARRTNNRATFLATKGVMSALLGPFAGLMLKSIGFSNQSRRQQYVAKIRNKNLVSRLDDRIPESIKRSLEKNRLFRVVLTLAVLVIAVAVGLRGTLDAFLLLGLLVLASKMLSVSLRVLALDLLVSRGFGYSAS